MFSFSIYPENGIKCVLLGDDIQSALSANQNILMHYLGKKTKIIKYKISDTGNEEIRKYKVEIEYSKCEKYIDENGKILHTALWVDELPYVKMPWEK